VNDLDNMMTETAARKLIGAALLQLNEAVGEMLRATTPATPLPRPRVFVLGGHPKSQKAVVWPVVDNSTVDFSAARILLPNECMRSRRIQQINRKIGSPVLTDAIMETCGGQPKLLLRALRRIQAAAAWCRARAAGRERAAKEILRQQAHIAAALQAEAVVTTLVSVQ
jgi:hypothetical protein